MIVASPLLPATARLRDYLQLTKPRIILLLLISTAAGMLLASGSRLDPRLLLLTLVAGACAAGAANTLNCIYDRDIDAVMERTRQRPLPSGRISLSSAWAFALILAGGSYSLLSLGANPLAAQLAMAGIVLYVLVYTHWLKRHSDQNIVLGGSAGAVPPLVGWAAVTGGLDWPAWVLFALICLWTPPHFWALALLIREDYAAVGVPMLPCVVGEERTARQTLIYALLLLPVSLLLVWPLGVAGWFYAIAAIALGWELIRRCALLLQAPTDRDRARSLFRFSIAHLMLLCGCLGLEAMLR